MYPVALDLNKVPVLLAGKGELVERRFAGLKDAHAAQVTRKEIPTEQDIRAATIVLVAGVERAEAERIVNIAHAAGKLVNVEDVNDLCDFYFTANVRRGDLVIAVSTSGASPTLARKVRDAIGNLFGTEWIKRTEELKTLRLQWKHEGKSMREVIDASEAKIAGWLS
jgi:precorrin-2 dehydrogenase/sirohydrochlorin ferrochelatase